MSEPETRRVSAREVLVARLQAVAKQSPDYTVGGVFAQVWLDDIDAVEREAAALAGPGADRLQDAGQAMYDAIRPFWESVQRPDTVVEGGTLIHADHPIEHTAESALIAAMKQWDAALSRSETT